MSSSQESANGEKMSSSQEPANDATIAEKRRRMLERLATRHGAAAAVTESGGETAGVCGGDLSRSSATSVNYFDDIQSKANALVSKPDATVDTALLKEMECALALLPSGLQSRRILEAYNVLRARAQQQTAGGRATTGFSFSSKGKASKAPRAEGDQHHEVRKEAAAMKKHENVAVPQMARNKDYVCISGKKNETIRVEGTDGQDVSLSDVDCCRVVVDFGASAVHLKNVTRSTVLTAPVGSSILIRDCDTLTLAAAAQQIRIHNSRELALHVAVRGAVIIEDCEGVRVAPYRMKGVQLPWHNDNWRNLKDFNWLVANQQSPHWLVMDDDLWTEFCLDVQQP